MLTLYRVRSARNASPIRPRTDYLIVSGEAVVAAVVVLVVLAHR
jgi:hypothetical protein